MSKRSRVRYTNTHMAALDVVLEREWELNEEREWFNTRIATLEQIQRDAEIRTNLEALQSTAFGRMQTYTTVVVFGGYAALFTVWNFMRDQIPAPNQYWVAIFAGVSLLLFVFHEVYAMTTRAENSEKRYRRLAATAGEHDWLAEWQAIDKEERAFDQRVLRRVWSICLFLIVVCALVASVILLVSFFDAIRAPVAQ